MSSLLEIALEAYERQQERQYELEQERKARREAEDRANADKWAEGFLAIDVDLAADKVHMLELIDRAKGTNLVEQGLQAVFEKLRLDAYGG